MWCPACASDSPAESEVTLTLLLLNPNAVCDSITKTRVQMKCLMIFFSRIPPDGDEVKRRLQKLVSIVNADLPLSSSIASASAIVINPPVLEMPAIVF